MASLLHQLLLHLGGEFLKDRLIVQRQDGRIAGEHAGFPLVEGHLQICKCLFLPNAAQVSASSCAEPEPGPNSNCVRCILGNRQSPSVVAPRGIARDSVNPNEGVHGPAESSRTGRDCEVDRFGVISEQLLLSPSERVAQRLSSCGQRLRVFASWA